MSNRSRSASEYDLSAIMHSRGKSQMYWADENFTPSTIEHMDDPSGLVDIKLFGHASERVPEQQPIPLESALDDFSLISQVPWLANQRALSGSLPDPVVVEDVVEEDAETEEILDEPDLNTIQVSDTTTVKELIDSCGIDILSKVQDAVDSSARVNRFRWAEEFALALEQGGQSLHRVSDDFITECTHYAKTIILELRLPKERRSIPRLTLGGVAGGLKYVHDSILFKVPQDTLIGQERYLYGDKHANNGLAIRAASNELVGMIHYFKNLDENYQVPIQVSVDFQGFRVVAMPLLPITNETLLYGSSDGGKTVYNDSKAGDVMKRAAEALHLAGHKVSGREMYSAGDVEVHLGLDNIHYVLDLGRAMPPECPRTAFEFTGLPMLDRAIFWRKLRPEFLQTLKNSSTPPLSPDAYSGWGSEDSDIHNPRIADATRVLLLDVVPKLSASLDLLNPKFIPQLNISEEFHRLGVNIRHIGLVASICKSTVIRQRLFIEILFRTCKNLVLREMRFVQNRSSNYSPYHIKSRVVQFLNLICGSVADPVFWSSVLPHEISYRFGRRILEHIPIYEVAQKHCVQVISLILDRCGIVLTQSTRDYFLQHGHGFYFVSADIWHFKASTKTLPLIELSIAKSCVQQCSKLKTLSHQEFRLRALGLSFAKKVLQQDPSDEQAHLLSSVLTISALNVTEISSLEALFFDKIYQVKKSLVSERRRMVLDLLSRSIVTPTFPEFHRFPEILNFVLELWDVSLFVALSQVLALCLICFEDTPESTYIDPWERLINRHLYRQLLKKLRNQFVEFMEVVDYSPVYDICSIPWLKFLTVADPFEAAVLETSVFLWLDKPRRKWKFSSKFPLYSHTLLPLDNEVTGILPHPLFIVEDFLDLWTIEFLTMHVKAMLDFPVTIHFEYMLNCLRPSAFPDGVSDGDCKVLCHIIITIAWLCHLMNGLLILKQDSQAEYICQTLRSRTQVLFEAMKFHFSEQQISKFRHMLTLPVQTDAFKDFVFQVINDILVSNHSLSPSRNLVESSSLFQVLDPSQKPDLDELLSRGYNIQGCHVTGIPVALTPATVWKKKTKDIRDALERYELVTICAYNEKDPFYMDCGPVTIGDRDPLPFELVQKFCVLVEDELVEKGDKSLVLLVEGPKGVFNLCAMLAVAFLVYSHVAPDLTEAIWMVAQSRTLNTRIPFSASQYRYLLYWEALHRIQKLYPVYTPIPFKEMRFFISLKDIHLNFLDFSNEFLDLITHSRIVVRIAQTYSELSDLQTIRLNHGIFKASSKASTKRIRRRRSVSLNKSAAKSVFGKRRSKSSRALPTKLQNVKNLSVDEEFGEEEYGMLWELSGCRVDLSGNIAICFELERDGGGKVWKGKDNTPLFKFHLHTDWMDSGGKLLLLENDLDNLAFSLVNKLKVEIAYDKVEEAEVSQHLNFVPGFGLPHVDCKSILVLGRSNAGKSTFCKQIRQEYGEPYIDKEIENFSSILRENMLFNLLELTRHLLETETIIMGFQVKEVFETLDSIDIIALTKLVQSEEIWKERIDFLWKDKGLQEFLRKNIWHNFGYDNWSYCLQELPLRGVLNPDYDPMWDEAVRAYEPTSGRHTEMFKIGLHLWRVLDVGGSVDEIGRNWNGFGGEDIIVYVANLAGYCESSEVDPGLSVLELSRNTFENVCNDKRWSSARLVLLLNKIDLFAWKLESQGLNNYFPGYNGSTVQDASVFIMDWFTLKIPRRVRVFVTNNTDPQSVKCIVTALCVEVNPIVRVHSSSIFGPTTSRTEDHISEE